MTANVGVFMRALQTMLEADEWKTLGNCAGIKDTQLTDRVFFEGGGNTLTAKAICEGCPVKARCGDTAKNFADPYGVWGGLSPEERAVDAA